MPDEFQRRVRAAAVAGWWTLLFAVGFLATAWFAYRGLQAIRPPWMLSLWGPDTTWPLIETIALWMFAVAKVAVWLMLFAVVWLTFWARKLEGETDNA